MQRRLFRFAILCMLLLGLGEVGASVEEKKEVKHRTFVQLTAERCVVIQASPRWLETPDGRWLVLTGENGETLKIFPPAQALPDKKLKFTVYVSECVIRREEDGSTRTLPMTDLDSITDSDTTYFDASDCPVHHVHMSRG